MDNQSSISERFKLIKQALKLGRPHSVIPKEWHQVSLSRREWLMVRDGLLVVEIMLREKLDVQPPSFFTFGDTDEEITANFHSATHVWNVLLPQRAVATKDLRDSDRIAITFTTNERTALNYTWFAVFPRMLEYEDGTREEFPYERLPQKAHWPVFMETLASAGITVEQALPQ